MHFGPNGMSTQLIILLMNTVWQLIMLLKKPWRILSLVCEVESFIVPCSWCTSVWDKWKASVLSPQWERCHRYTANHRVTQMFSQERVALWESSRALSRNNWECEQKAGALLKEGTGGCFHGHGSDQGGPTVNSSRIRVEIPGSPPIRGCKIPAAAPGSSALPPRCEHLSLIVYSRRNVLKHKQLANLRRRHLGAP